MRLDSKTRRKIHEIAQRMGIDRRAIAPLTGLESGNGGAPCQLCEGFRLTGGLEFTDLTVTSRAGAITATEFDVRAKALVRKSG